MTKNSPLLITALAWIVLSAPAAAESSPDTVANPSSVATQTQAIVSENAVVDAPVTCEYGCEDHREGTEICINKKQHRCGRQGWHPTGLICANPPPVAR
jgi:hypothetical protein